MRNKTKAFFTDLDGTILFSKTEGINPEELIEVEEHTTGTKGYFTKKEIALIEKIRAVGLLIPTTTRSIKQALRIDVINQSEYILCANGGILLVNGEVDKEFDRFMNVLFKTNRIDLIKTVADIEEFSMGLVEFIKIIDKRFIYMKTKKVEELDEFLCILEEYFKQSNYDVWKVGNKLYVIPSFVKKGVGIAYLIANMNIDYSIGAGDTLMDISMLDAVDISIAPQHKQFLRNTCYETKCTGIKAGEEILEQAYKILKTTL